MNKLIIPFMLTGALLLASFSMLAPGVRFDKTEHDFGTIPQGDPVSCEFTFTNDGDAPLILTDVKASCGCTTPDWPQEPIMPGAKGVIKATYNAAAAGAFDKTITVYSNSSKPELILKLKGVVEKGFIKEENGTELKLN
jgi:hypothetical protein